MVNGKCQQCGSQKFEEYSQGSDAVLFSEQRKGLFKERQSIMRFVKNAKGQKHLCKIQMNLFELSSL